MPSSIEDKLKEYRRCKEKEREAELLSKKSVWEKYFPPKVAQLLKFEAPQESNTIVKSADELIEDDQDSLKANVVVENLATSEPPLINRALLRKKSKPLTAKGHVPQIKSGEELGNKGIKVSGSIPTLNTSDPKEFKWMLLLLKISLWIVLYLLFLELEWGAVYVILSAFYLIFTNFRNGQRKSWEPSAYSVFNPGCEAIDGTLKPEQFEKEIRYGF